MSFYLDTSVLVSSTANESMSERARTFLKSATDVTIIADLAALEFGAAISRTVRTGQASHAEARETLADFDLMRAASLSHSHTRSDYALADDLIRDFSTKLAAADALHLASAINLGAALVTFDQRLAEAARGHAVAVVTP